MTTHNADGTAENLVSATGPGERPISTKAKNENILRLLSLRARIFFPTRESTTASKTRETRSQQPPYSISTGSLILQRGSFSENTGS
jgi:hypothetical protein